MVNHAVRSARWLWLRWSWRDLRRHWVAVAAIALVLAIGVGVFAGLGSTATWRRVSNDASFSAQAMHDVRVSLSPGTFTDQGSLEQALRGIDDADAVDAVAERLVVDSQVEAFDGTESTLAAARLVGMDLTDEAAVDRLWLREGTVPTGQPGGGLEGVLEAKFADAVGLDPDGSLIIAGGQRVDYRGLGVIPEDFYYEGPEGTLLGQGELAPLYLALDAAQEVVGRPGQVNDLVLTLKADADRDSVVAQVTEAFDSIAVSATVSTRDDATAVLVLYEDIENDQQFWNALAGLVLFAAALAAFNLVSRIVESQRREIGIGMALGVPRTSLAIRPMLVGIQVAILGVIAGVGVGLLVGVAMGNVLESFLPLPNHQTPFQFGVFVQAAALGLAIPLLASAIPTLRAVRVEPIEAIRTGHLTAKTSRLTDWTGRLRLPGSSLVQMPLRNVLRTPRRTVLTAVGVGAAITALVAVLGMLDSFGRTIDQVSDELTQGDRTRVMVQLDTFYPAESGPVVDIAALPAVGATDAGLRLPATGLGPDEADDLDLLVELVDFDRARWAPTIEVADGGDGSAGVVLAAKAATDLGVGPGDVITLRHPVQSSQGVFELFESQFEVSGIHANPMRAFAFMDIAEDERFGLDGMVNFLHAYPAAGTTRNDLQRALFGLPGVTSSQSVARVGESFDEALDQFVGVLVIAGLAVLALALLIAFNAVRITVEERSREHATMRAFGLPVRTVMGVVVKESVIVGVLATVIGTVAGFVFLDWMLQSLASRTLPDLRIESYLSPTTLVLAIGVGVVAVALAPLFLIRRLTNMSIPDTLRVME